MASAEPIHRGRREYADLIDQRRSIERVIAANHGTLEPRSAKVKKGFLGFLLGMFLGDLLRGN